MTFLINDPAAFAEEFIEGFVAANRNLCQAVPGGVIRAAQQPRGEVAVITGGGTGHYPAFAGLVGQGMAHGAALGNVFASPSVNQVVSVARRAANGGGVLLVYGNYAGDCLNFDSAEVSLREQGIPCRTVRVTDDISSAAVDQSVKRRGVAGDLCVLKAAGWAAEQGLSLDEVWRVADKANGNTRSLGIAFTGCTLPGADAPLFTVPVGKMALGMGIHGEPGLEELPLASADEAAGMLVTRLLEERPEAAGGRVAPVLNGLGAISHEELFVVYRAIERELRSAGMTTVQPEVGEFCTSFDMAGLSLTLLWLDEELETAWLAPVDTPTHRRGNAPTRPLRSAEAQQHCISQAPLPAATDPSRAAAAKAAVAIAAAAATIREAANQLGKLDAVAGDGDHGIGMSRGVSAAEEAAAEVVSAGGGLGSTLGRAGQAWSDRAGGTSGMLWGLILETLGLRLGDHEAPNSATIAVAVEQAAEAVETAGRAALGDKTMLDALIPFAKELSLRSARGEELAEAWAAAAERARQAADATAGMLPKIGRARLHAKRSLGTPDPGAVSMAMVAAAVGEALSAEKSASRRAL
ncbi:MAG: dihydroxyacetone kinase family protein [Bifidobacteriaceae bacterium]|jgi:dihydroxyacetone kinase|nr:dihydroxyacetone kinase family protein [Bifidobacteriaceae bacterium]